MKNLKVLLYIIILITSCTIGAQKMKYSEMTNPPTIKIINDSLITVNTENSNTNSALSLYKIEYSIDTVKKVIYFTGFQAINKKFKNRFKIKINNLDKIQLESYQYFWIDPNKTVTKIEVIK